MVYRRPRYWLHVLGSRLARREPLDRFDYEAGLLYPDVVEVGLSALLQRELDRIAPGLGTVQPDPESLQWRGVGIEREGTKAWVECRYSEREFYLSLVADDLLHLDGRTGELADAADPICAWFSEPRPGGEAMAVMFPFLEFDPLTRAIERGEAIEYLWRELLDDPPEYIRPLIEAAAAEPRLRRLRPYTSLDSLRFSRWVIWPFSGDLPYAQPESQFGQGGEGRFRVFRPNVVKHLRGSHVEFGVGDAARAVELLVGALPERVEVTLRRPTSASGGE